MSDKEISPPKFEEIIDVQYAAPCRVLSVDTDEVNSQVHFTIEIVNHSQKFIVAVSILDTKDQAVLNRHLEGACILYISDLIRKGIESKC